MGAFGEEENETRGEEEIFISNFILNSLAHLLYSLLYEGLYGVSTQTVQNIA